MSRKSKPQPQELTPQQAAQLLLERRAADPIYQYKPAPTFQRVSECAEPNICLDSANQVGKTTFLQWLCVSLARGTHPHRKWYGGVRVLVIVPNRTHAAVDWGPRLLEKCELKGSCGDKPWLPASEIAGITTAHGGPMGSYPGCITLKNGSEIYFALSGVEQSWKRIEGLRFDHVIRDEISGSENLSDTIQRSLLAVRSSADTKPGGGLYLWATTATAVNDEWEDFKRRSLDHVPGHHYFRVDPAEANAYVSMEERQKLALVMSEESYAVRGLGTASAVDKDKIYKRYLTHPQLVRDTPYIVQPDDNLFIAYDPGIAHPCGIIYFAVNKQRPQQVQIVRFDCYKRGTRKEHIESMIHWLAGRTVTQIICDPAVNKGEATGRKYIEHFIEIAVQLGMKWHREPIIGRNINSDGIPNVISYLMESTPGRRVEFDPLSTDNGLSEAMNELELYRWKTDNTGKTTTEIYKRRDEMPDALKYALSREPYWNDYGSQDVEKPKEPVPVDPVELLWKQRVAHSMALLGEMEEQDGGLMVSGY